MNELLSSSLMYRLTKHQLTTKRLKRGHHRGGRRSTKQGASLEFSDYRSYQPGDDLRQIDWNIYARTNKHYIKRFLDEQEIVVSIFLDCTKSMTHIEEKWKVAKGLASALGYMSLTSDDRVGVFPVGSINPPFTYKKGRAFSNRLVHYVKEVEPNNELFTFSEAVQQLIQPRSSVTIIISDLLEPVVKVKEALRKLQAYNQELYVIQLLATEEIDPEYQGDLQLIDSETFESINVTMNLTVKRQYQDRLHSQINEINQFCHSRGIGFVQCQTNQPLEEILFRNFTSKGWIV